MVVGDDGEEEEEEEEEVVVEKDNEEEEDGDDGGDKEERGRHLHLPLCSAFCRVSSVPIATFRPETRRCNCSLCGCDYLPTLHGVGPKTAFRLINQHGSIEGIAAGLPAGSKIQIPDEWAFAQAREIFQDPVVTLDLDGEQSSFAARPRVNHQKDRC